MFYSSLSSNNKVLLFSISIINYVLQTVAPNGNNGGTIRHDPNDPISSWLDLMSEGMDETFVHTKLKSAYQQAKKGPKW
jgi:hypothetical protein